LSSRQGGQTTIPHSLRKKALIGYVSIVNPNSRYEDGQTPLSRATQSRREAMFKLLLANSVDLDSKDNHDITLLSWATRTGYDAAVKLLLAKGGVDPDSRDNDGRTLLSVGDR
jgi:ankyrin repeat protein